MNRNKKTNDQICPEDTLRIAGIIRESIVDGPGLRFAIFSQGCPHRCRGCHNEATHDFNGGYDCGLNRILEEIDSSPLISGVTFTGGEPFCQPEAFYKLAVEIKKKGLDLLAYSGYTLEELQVMSAIDANIDRLLRIIDYLVDGPFIAEEKDLTLEFRGSRNQRFLSMSDIRDIREYEK